MLFCRQVNFFPVSRCLAAAIALTLFISSCTIPGKFQKGKPFVYSSDVKLQNVDDLSNSEKQQLRQALSNQVDDSLQVRKVLTPFLFYRLNRPAAFDTLYIGRSKTFMTALLNSQGYFNPQITDTFWIDTVQRKKQMRTYVRFFVNPGRVLRYDSVGYDI